MSDESYVYAQPTANSVCRKIYFSKKLCRIKKSCKNFPMVKCKSLLSEFYIPSNGNFFFFFFPPTIVTNKM
jgi:hypothetical protein